MQGAVGEGFVVTVSATAAAAAVQTVATILTSLLPLVADTALRLRGAVVLGAVVLGAAAVSGVNLTRLQPGDLFGVSHVFK